MFAVASYVQYVSDNDGATILDTRVGQFLVLNRTGAFIWEGLQRGEGFEKIVEGLAEATGAEARKVEKDTRAFVEGLMNKGFVIENTQGPV